MTDLEEINHILRTAEVIRIGLVDNDMAYIVPMNFGYSEGVIYFHSSLQGKKVGILKKTDRISFETDRLVGIEKGGKGCDWSAYFFSVMGDGNVEFINDPDEKTAALKLIMEKYSGRTDWTFEKNILSRTLIFKLIIENISCKAALPGTAAEAEKIGKSK